jgi:hypothetical protein
MIFGIEVLKNLNNQVQKKVPFINIIRNEGRHDSKTYIAANMPSLTTRFW